MLRRSPRRGQLLADLGFDRERTNERSALVLLALLQLGPGDDWSNAANPMLGTRAIMDWISEQFDVQYAPNTRETVRRFTLHQFADALLVEQNPDQPDRPVNSPRWCYQVHANALKVIRAFGTPEYATLLFDHLIAVPGLKAQYDAAREMHRIPVNLPNGQPLPALSPGGQNVLIKQMVEDFCGDDTPGGEVLYVGDADAKWAVFEEAALADLGVTVDQHGKMPDLVVYLPAKNWLVLLEAASSHGPVDAKRRRELKRVVPALDSRMVYVSCFPSQVQMRKYLAEIAWE